MLNRIFLISLFCVTAVGLAQTKKPNIILYIADDLAAEDIGPYGNEIVRTPNLDRLEKESLLFTQAFAGSPTCGPSRSTIFTGLLPFRHGAHSNHTGTKEGVKSIVHYLKPQGYRVAIAGKLHVGPEEVFPFEKVSHTNVPEPGFENKPWLHWDLNMGPVENWLSDQKKEEPFMLIVADHSPHVIWPEDATYDPEKADIPERHIDTKDTRKSRARYYTDITKMDANLGRLLESLDKNKLSDNTIVVFISDQGPQWAFGKWNLYDYGLKSPMLVRWPGEVEPGRKTDALVSLVDLVPTFVQASGGSVPNGLDGVSIIPVLKQQTNSVRDMVFASHTGDKKMNRSPMRMLRTKQYKYILNLAPEIPFTTHMDKAKDHDGGREYWDSWRRQSFKDEHASAVLWRYHNRPEEELYDLETDPDEHHNLAKNPEYKELMKMFRNRMSAVRKQQGDFKTGPETGEDSVDGRRHEPVAPYIFKD